MAKCGFCSAKKGKRYCSPLDKVICPTCCAENRLERIDCNEDCRFLEGVSFQKKRADDKAFSQLLSQVGHGRHDDIFQNPDVPTMAFPIESLVRDFFVEGHPGITDTSVYNAYKSVYQIVFENKQPEGRIGELTDALLEQFERNQAAWKSNLDHDTMGKVYLRLMISVKAMTGGVFGEYGYLNYLKNNLDQDTPPDEVIIEDKYGHKRVKKVKKT